MSFNIKVYNANDKGYVNWSYRSNEIVKLLDTGLPDMICMQEVTKKQFDDLVKLLSDKYEVLANASTLGRVFVPFKSLIITEKTPDGAYYSDHYPVISKLKLSV